MAMQYYYSVMIHSNACHPINHVHYHKREKYKPSCTYVQVKLVAHAELRWNLFIPDRSRDHIKCPD